MKITPEFPKVFLARVEEELGSEYPDFLKSLSEPPFVSLRLNPSKCVNLFSGSKPVPWCGHGIYLKERPMFVFDPYIHAGAYYVQEASSMFIANFIDFSRDLKILDLCAAPGGKSTLLLSMMNQNSILFSNELVFNRASVLNENIVKWGGTNVIITNNRAEDFVNFINYFDVVLIDAPCSGEGLFRKSAKYIQEWNNNKSSRCSVVQKNIVEKALSLLKTGGTIIYSTCTFSPLENEEIVKWLDKMYLGKLIPNDAVINDNWNIKVENVLLGSGLNQKIYKFYPHRLKGEGFVVTSFMKTFDPGNQFVSSRRNKSSVLLKKAGNKEKEELKCFIDIAPGYEIFTKDESIYILPLKYFADISASFNSLKVIKAGVQAGTFNRKNKVFIPSHELALSPFLNKNIPAIELTETDAIRFLKKEDIYIKNPLGKSWIIAKYKNLPLGWLKNAGSRLNNFYPRNWKIRKSLENHFEDVL